MDLTMHADCHPDDVSCPNVFTRPCHVDDWLVAKLAGDVCLLFVCLFVAVMSHVVFI